MLEYFAGETTDATLVKHGVGVYSDADGGDWVPGITSNTPIRIIVPQPVKENELAQMSEGEKVSDFRKTYSETPLQTRREGVDADSIIYDGRTYKVFQCDDRSVLGEFYRVIMREVL